MPASPRRESTRGAQALKAAAVAVLAVALPVGALDAAWFERPFAVALVTTGPMLPRAEQGMLHLGDHALRLEGVQDDVPYVVLYRFGADEVIMDMLDPVSLFVTSVRFEVDQPVDVDLLVLGAITLAPDHEAHPCLAYPDQATCVLEGQEAMHELTSERWAVTLDDGFGHVEAFTVWVDLAERLVRRTAYSDGSRIDFVGYELEPQRPELFEIPEGFERQ